MSQFYEKMARTPPPPQQEAYATWALSTKVQKITKC